MISKATDVDAYVKEVAPERRPAIDKLRGMIRNIMPDASECIDYGMPCYKRNGALVVSFASQKQYIALYGCGSHAAEFRPLLIGANFGKGCIRFPRPDRIDFEVLGQLLRKVEKAKPSGC